MLNKIWWLLTATIHNHRHFGWHRQKIHQTKQRAIGYRIQYVRISHTTIYYHTNLYKTLGYNEPSANYKLFRHLLATHHYLHIFRWLWPKTICWTLPTNCYQRVKGRNRKNILITTTLSLHNTTLQQYRILHRSVTLSPSGFVKRRNKVRCRTSTE